MRAALALVAALAVTPAIAETGKELLDAKIKACQENSRPDPNTKLRLSWVDEDQIKECERILFFCQRVRNRALCEKELEN